MIEYILLIVQMAILVSVVFWINRDASDRGFEDRVRWIWAIGLIDNLYAINKANELCNRYGVDTIDFGGVCAFAMELLQWSYMRKVKLTKMI